MVVNLIIKVKGVQPIMIQRINYNGTIYNSIEQMCNALKISKHTFRTFKRMYYRNQPVDKEVIDAYLKKMSVRNADRLNYADLKLMYQGKRMSAKAFLNLTGLTRTYFKRIYIKYNCNIKETMHHIETETYAYENKRYPRLSTLCSKQGVDEWSVTELMAKGYSTTRAVNILKQDKHK